MPRPRKPPDNPPPGSPRRRPGGDSSGPQSIAQWQDEIGDAALHGRQSEAQRTSGTPQLVGPVAKIPLRPPNTRHNLNGIRPSNPTKLKNTVVLLPGTDVGKDLDDITAGRATWHSEGNFYEVNGRSYGVEGNGTVFRSPGPASHGCPAPNTRSSSS